ncbi:MAG: hypothetical protein GY696_06190, partial [Gammaproteobacteria bacterium]|nr:hypothetical protein [Gammaproteobacteria bacterium]
MYPSNITKRQWKDDIGAGWQDLPYGPAAQEEPTQQQPAQQGQAQQLHALANAMAEDQKKDYAFVTRDRLRGCVPKFRGPMVDCWHLWKQKWSTAGENSVHPAADTKGFRRALKEAIVDDAA